MIYKPINNYLPAQAMACAMAGGPARRSIGHSIGRRERLND